MNVHADVLATDDNCADPSKLVPSIPASQASLTIHGATITRRYAQRLRQAANRPQIVKRLMTRNACNIQTFGSIDWDTSGKALATMENSAQIFIVKFAHNHLPIHRHMYRMKRAETDKCPACNHIVKTDWHILSCPRCSIWWEELLRTLGDLLAINKIQLDLALILLQGIRGALSNQHFQMNPNNREPSFRTLVKAQNKSAGSICSKDDSANTEPKSKAATSWMTQTSTTRNNQETDAMTQTRTKSFMDSNMASLAHLK
jgi:hypothetical protein